MNRFVLLILCSTWSFVRVDSAEDGDDVMTSESAMDLTMSVFRNSSGEWITLFSAERALGASDKGMDVRIKHAVFKSGEKNIVRVSGIVRDAEYSVDVVKPERSGKEGNVSMFNETTYDGRKVDHPVVLRFHEKTAKYIVLDNDRRSAYRKDPTQNAVYGGVFTDRPLMDDEMFQVKIDQVINTRTSSYFVYLGVTLQTPHDIDNERLLANQENGVWAMWINSVAKDGAVVNGSYPLILENLSVGTRIGVMRKKNGDLHFYLNGTDKGLAAENIPGSVYGIFNLVNYVSRISIAE